ncbi:MAG: copper-binding protein [Gemmataceae bacterium]|nr:copper-binding protein [Gemmataceae bacterium]
MKTFLLLPLVVCWIPLASMGCGRGGGDKDKVYDIKGKVVAVDADKKKVTLDHDDIPGLMKAMEMPFAVENAKVLEGIKAGDQVHGKLKVKGGDYIIVELRKH